MLPKQRSGGALESGYESAINAKVHALMILEGYIAEYNMAYFAYSQIFDSHYTWATHEGAVSLRTHVKTPWIPDWQYDIGDLRHLTNRGDFKTMLSELLSNRVFMGSLGCLVLLGIGCLFYLNYLKRQVQ